MSATWQKENVDYLLDNWGIVSVSRLSQILNRTETAVTIKAHKLGLGAFLDNGEYITVNQFFKAIGRNGALTYTLMQWTKKGFPVKRKKVRNYSFKVVYLNDFWEWAKKYRTIIDFSKFEKNVLGLEPSWVKEQRKADIEFSKYKVNPWTKEEDNLLKSLLKKYKYTYKEISMQVLRTEGAIKRRINDLCLDTWPIREPPHGIWIDKQITIVVDMYNKGYKNDVIKEYIDKSAMAIGGKIERLIRDGILEKRNK